MPPSSPIRLLVVDDHSIIRQGLAAVFQGSAILIAGEATDADEAVMMARKLRPDVVMLDVRLESSDGISAIKPIVKASGNSRIVMFSTFDSSTYIARAISAGAHDYLLKTASRQELIDAVTNAAAGTPPPRSGKYRQMVGTMADKTAPDDLEVPLTPRETQVLRLVALGLSNQEIADSLAISIETVKEHVQNLLRKIDVGDRTQAAVWAIRCGLSQ